MNDIPLIQKADINSINTSIIAIKKQLKQLNEALGLVDVPSIDTSVFVKKSDVVDVVEAGNMNPVTSNAVVPVDEVTSGNMQSVTSNAVADKLNGLIKYYDVNYGNKTLPSANYASLGVILPNKIIIGYAIKYWSANSDCFNIMNYINNNQNDIYLIGKSGSYINQLQVRFYYIDI